TLPALRSSRNRRLHPRLPPRRAGHPCGVHKGDQPMSAGFLTRYGSAIATLSMEHVWLTGAAMLFATAIAVPAGIWLTRAPRWATPVIGAANVLQTIPSLAMFGFLLPLPWLGERAARIAILALTAYALLPIVRNTY